MKISPEVRRNFFITLAVLAAVIFAVTLMLKGKKSASSDVKKADQREKEKLEEESYEKILADDSEGDK